LERMLSGSYDITSSQSNPLLTAFFECSNETYLLSERFTLWGATDKELVHVYRITENGSVDGILEESWTSGIGTLDPSKGHRSSNIITILLCDSVDDAMAKKVRGYVRRKSFRFTLDGTVVHRAIAVDLLSKEVFFGKGMGKMAKSISKSIGGTQ